MEYVIRQCEERDMEALIELCVAHAAYERASFSREGKISLLSAALFRTPQRVYCMVVEQDSQLVGYCSYTFDFSTWEARPYLHMDCLYLEEAHRGAGLGKRFIEKLIDIAQQHNCVNIQWQTPTFNLPAIGFYKKIGAEGKEKLRFTLTL